MLISMLIENQKPINGNVLKNEHGLSLYIEKHNEAILFDTGVSGSFIENAANMDIDLEKVSTVVLSHAHSDHASGLKDFLKINKKAKVYMSKNACQDLYVKLLFIKENISVDNEIFTQYSNRIVFIDDFSEIMSDVYIIPNITKHPYPLGKSRKKLLVKSNGKFKQDSFNHELIMVINNNEKLVIVAGCGHNGITNMVDEVKHFFPESPIQAVISGFHLMGIPFGSMLGESRAYIEGLARRMQSYNIEMTYTAHCTGIKAFKILKDIMQDRICYMYTGTKIEL